MKYLIQKKSGTWYFRYQVPFLYRRFFNNRTEIKKSLKTSDKIVASINALRLEATIKERIMSIKQCLSIESANELIATHAGATLMKIESAQNPMGDLSNAYMKLHIERALTEPDLTSEEISALMSPVENLHKAGSTSLELANDVLSPFELSPLDPLAWQTKQALSQVFQHAKDAQTALKNSDTDSCKQIVRQLERMVMAANPDPVLAASLLSEPKAQESTPPIVSKPVDRRTLKELFEEYKVERRISKKRTIDALEAKVHTVSELLNDLPASQITRKQAVSVREKLLKLPSNSGKKKAFRDLTKLEAIEKNNNLPEPHNCLALNTVAGYLEKISSIYIWAMRFQYVTHNPFDTIEVISGNDEIDERLPFNTVQLTTLFSTPIFTENTMQHSYQYWSLLIAIYSGARQNEIAQLYTDNIKKIDGIWCFVFRKKRSLQNFKNDASERITPIHERLIELGFLTFVESCDERLFATGLPFYENLGYAKELSRWFNGEKGYKQRLGFKANAKTDFHSFRHTVIDFFKQKTNLEERFVQGIVGHKHKSITFDRYGSEFRPSVLKPMVDQINWDFLDIQPFDMKKHVERTEKELAKATRRKKNKERKVKLEKETMA